MKALLLKQYMQMELADVPVPEIGLRDVLVRVKACGICGSDVHGFDGSTGRRIPPIIMGHEAAGVIERAGPAVTKCKPGDRVTFDSTIYCGGCFYCRRGQVNLCDHREVLGVSPGTYRRHGAFAEFVAVPEYILYPLADSLPFYRAAVVEAVSIAVHAASLTPVALGDTAVVVGSGMIGLLAIQALRLAGCARVIAVDPDASRLALALKLGAEVGLNPATQDVPARVAELTEGRGADVALECAGLSPSLQTAIASVRKGGAVTLIGNLAPTVDLPLQSVVTRQIRLSGSCASSGEYPASIDLIARGAIEVDPIVTARAPLEEGAEWFHRLYNKEPGQMKVVLEL
jgi:L-iditol 2-dehydrogenase